MTSANDPPPPNPPPPGLPRQHGGKSRDPTHPDELIQAIQRLEAQLHRMNENLETLAAKIGTAYPPVQPGGRTDLVGPRGGSRNIVVQAGPVPEPVPARAGGTGTVQPKWWRPQPALLMTLLYFIGVIAGLVLFWFLTGKDGGR
jgi:hypothetical protein